MEHGYLSSGLAEKKFRGLGIHWKPFLGTQRSLEVGQSFLIGIRRQRSLSSQQRIMHQLFYSQYRRGLDEMVSQLSGVGL